MATQPRTSIVLPAVQRFAIAHHDRESAQRALEWAQRTMQFEEAAAVREMRAAGIPERQRYTATLLGGYNVELFYVNARIVVL